MMSAAEEDVVHLVAVHASHQKNVRPESPAALLKVLDLVEYLDIVQDSAERVVAARYLWCSVSCVLQPPAPILALARRNH